MNRIRTASGLAAVILMLALIVAGCGSGQANNNGGASGSSSQADGTAANEASASPSPSPSPAESEQWRTVTDDLGHELTIPARPQRILAPYLEDPLAVLGVKPVAQWANGDIVQDYLQDELKDIPKVDFSGGGLVPEQAAAQSPDLIVLVFADWAQKGMYEAYSKIAPTYVFENGLKDWKGTLRKLGELTGEPDKAEQAIAEFDKQAADAKAKIRAAIGDEQVALLWPTGGSIYLLSDQDYSGNLLYGELGVTEPPLAKGSSFQQLSLEKLPELGDAHILLITQYSDEEAGQLQSKEIWKQLPAVKEGRVHEISWNHWMSSGLIANRLNLEDAVKLLAP